jgi:putative permease
MNRHLQGIVRKYLSHDEAVSLFLLLVFSTLAIVFLGGMLIPVIAAVVIAYILQGLVDKLTFMRVPNPLAILLAYGVFIGFVGLMVLTLAPLIWKQAVTLVSEAPQILRTLNSHLETVVEQYPQVLSPDLVDSLYRNITEEAGKFTQWALSSSLSGLMDVAVLLVYAVLVPILVFFMLKDRRTLTASIGRLLPDRRKTLNEVWKEVDHQCSAYIRGKTIEILIVGIVSYIALKVMGMPYSALLGLLIGLSVVIPFVGAAVVTIPVTLIALSTFGPGTEFLWVMMVYGIIQALDGNVLTPLLFSEVNNLHPVVIIVAVLLFGGIWGLWGVFFAIPLATLVRAVMDAWPVHLDEEPAALD